jgi:hypothetical protein
VPSGRNATSPQVGAEAADAQEVVPERQGFAGWHGSPGTQAAATHAPALHTLPSPQAVPSARNAPVSTQAGAPPVQRIVASPQGFGAPQAAPSTHAAPDLLEPPHPAAVATSNSADPTSHPHRMSPPSSSAEGRPAPAPAETLREVTPLPV